MDSRKSDKIVQQVKKRFKRIEDWESDARRLYLDDIKFAAADADNGYQWPDSLRRSREFDARPCLTINKTNQHNLLIINDAKQNKPSVTVHPVSDEASYDAAQVFEGIIRHIEYISDAQVAYDTATECQVNGGIGYWRMLTDYVDDKSFDQEIYICRIRDPLTVGLDPDIKEADGSDAEYGMIHCDLSHDLFKIKHPKFAYLVDPNNVADEGDAWLASDHIRLCEYYRKEYSQDILVAVPDPQTGELTSLLWSEIPAQARADLDAMGSVVQKRPLQVCKIRWYLIAGHEVIDDKDWAGKYIPIFRVVGQETVIEGILDRKGHTRALKDPQRMYNYWTSSAVEFVALQGKQPYIGSTRAIEGYEKYWENANRENYAILPYKDIADDGTPIPMPQRQQPPVMAQGYINGMQNAANEMAMVSGQYQASFGAPSNEDSGVAINQRRKQGSTATFHFVDNLARAIRFTGKALIDLIPKIYDTQRVIRILGIDGSEDSVQIDPQQPQALQEIQIEQGKVQRIFNPNVGKYDVVSDTGPAYQTRREEAFQAISQILSQNPEMAKVVGDLMFKAADFPMADEIAQRLARMVPPNLKEDGPDPQIQQLQQQLQQAHGVIQAGQKALDEKAADTAVDEYKAETDRLKVLSPAMDPRELRALVQKLVAETLNGVLPLPPSAPQQGNMPPPGAPIPTPGGPPGVISP